MGKGSRVSAKLGRGEDERSSTSGGIGSKVRSMLRRSTKEVSSPAANFDKFTLIMNRYWDYELRSNPESASFFGIHDYDDRLSNLSEAQNDADIVTCEMTLRALDKLFPDTKLSLQGWTRDQKTTFFYFKSMLETNLVNAKDRMFMMPVNSMSSFHTGITQMIPKMRFRNADDFEIYKRRLAEVPRVLAEHITVMRQGMKEGMLPAKVTVEAVPEQIASLVENSRKPDGPFRGVLANFDNICKDPTAKPLKEAIETTIATCVTAPFIEFAKFIKDEYLPVLPEEVSMSKRLAKGAEYYTHACQTHTTTNLTASEIHDIGLKEVQRIRDEMEKVANLEGFNGENAIDEYAAHLDSSDEYVAKSVDELLTAYRAKCMEVLPELPRLFGKLPRATFGVRAIPEFMADSAPGAYYEPPSEDGSQPGWFNANCSHLTMRKLYTVEALVLHESVPGHHMQIALQMENNDLPPLRKFTFSTAYVEGWGLYCESLGKELGFYKEPSSWFGRLSAEMLRACRLVVDTGMHHHGWTKEKAMDFMRVNKAGTEKEIDSETTRYIGWPGQALAYKIGEIKLHDLRKMATESLGDKFDIREFHDVVLAVGGVSLTALEQVVVDWVEEKKTGVAAN